MTPTTHTNKWIPISAGIVLLASFFLPWLNWSGTTVSGYHMPSGGFFSISEDKFGLANPFPQINLGSIIFWLIPFLAILTIFLSAKGKKITWPGIIAGGLALSLATMFVLFTNTIIEDVGSIESLVPALKFGLYATFIAGAGIIIASLPQKWWLGAILIVAAPLATWMGYAFLKGTIDKEHDDTAGLKPAYTVNALEFIREFQANDSLANARYAEQIITVNGIVSEIEMPNDSTMTLKMNDTTGSYAIFSFDKEQVARAKDIKQGDQVSVKGSCSGGEYSEILDVHFITFKRSIINKQ